MKHAKTSVLIALVLGLIFAAFVGAQASNNPPTHSNPILTSTSGRGLNNDDLTCSPVNLTDPENDPITKIFNYKLNDSPWTALNIPFEPNQQNIAKDYSGRGNDGAYRGANLSLDIVNGYAAIFDGQDDYVEVPYAQSLNLATSFTVEAWINATDIAPTSIILGRGNSTPTAINYVLGIIESKPSFGFTKEDFSGVSAASQEAIAPNEWFHLVGAYDGAMLRLYVNGELKGTADYTGIIRRDTGNIYIGGDVPNSRYFFNGKIDEAKIYSRALTQDQIREHFNLRYNIIKANETQPSDRWQCELTPNDGQVDGQTKASNIITVIEPLVNRVYIQPPARKVTTNRTFMIETAIAMVDPTFAAQFNLRFDPNLMTALNVTEGGFLRQGNVQTYPSFAIDNENGTVRFWNTRQDGRNGGVNGTGMLARITFRMKSIDRGVRDGAFDLSDVILVDVNNTMLSAEINRGRFVIRHLEGDVNNDNRVDVQDLAAVGIAFTSRPGEQFYNLDADLIEDDLIDIFDLSLVGINLGGEADNGL